MEVMVSIGIKEADISGRFYDFDVVAFYPGKYRVGALDEGWKEAREDVSVMPVAHLIERAFNQDSMVVYKAPDHLSSRLMDAHSKGTLLTGLVRVYMKSNGQKSVQVGKYYFDFNVKQMKINQVTDEGRRFERIELKIKDQTEEIMGLAE